MRNEVIILILFFNLLFIGNAIVINNEGKHHTGPESNTEVTKRDKIDSDIPNQSSIIVTANTQIPSLITANKKVPFISIEESYKDSSIGARKKKISSVLSRNLLISSTRAQTTTSLHDKEEANLYSGVAQTRTYSLPNALKNTPRFISSLFLVPTQTNDTGGGKTDSKEFYDDFADGDTRKVIINGGRKFEKSDLFTEDYYTLSYTNFTTLSFNRQTSTKNISAIKEEKEKIITRRINDTTLVATALALNGSSRGGISETSYNQNTVMKTIFPKFLEYKPTAQTVMKVTNHQQSDEHKLNVPSNQDQERQHAPLVTKGDSRFHINPLPRSPLQPLSFSRASFRSSYSAPHYNNRRPPHNNNYPSPGSSSYSSSSSRTTFDPNSPTNISAQLGSSTYLPCKIRNVGNKTVSWIRSRDSHIISVDRYTFIADQRFQSWHEENSDTWTLVIRYVQERDDGRYECQVSTEPKMSYFVHFRVVSPIVKIPGGSDIHVKVGSTVALKCIISAALKQPDYIFWYQGYERVVSSESGRQIFLERIANDSTIGTLIIPHARPRDAGLYQCVPEKLNTANVTLHVINGEHPAAMQRGTSVMTRPGSPNLLFAALGFIFLIDNLSLLSVSIIRTRFSCDE